MCELGTDCSDCGPDRDSSPWPNVFGVADSDSSLMAGVFGDSSLMAGVFGDSSLMAGVFGVAGAIALVAVVVGGCCICICICICCCVCKKRADQGANLV